MRYKLFKRIIALALCAVVMFSFAGCVNKVARTDETVIATINGTDLTWGEFWLQYQGVVSYYKQNGVDLLDPASAEEDAYFREQLLNEIVKATARMQKIDELGLSDLTDEETAEIQAAAQAEYDRNYNEYRAKLEGLSDEAAVPVIEKYLQDNGMTLPAILNTAHINYLEQKLYDYATQNLDVDEESIKVQYTMYTADLDADFKESKLFFQSAWNNNLLLTKCLTGFYAYEFLCVPLSEAQELEIGILKDNKDPSYKNRRDEYLATVLDDALAAIERLESGEDFKSVQADYGTNGYYDPENPPQGIGYCISEYSTDFAIEVRIAAAALREDGDFTSEPIPSDEGYFIIKRIKKILASDAKTMEEAHDTFYKSALNEMKYYVYQMFNDALVAGADVVLHKDLIY